MVAGRAKDPDGPSEEQRSEEQRSEQGNFQQEQQSDEHSERELQQQRFRKVRRNDPRDLQNRLFQDAVGTAPSESSQLGSYRAQLRKT